MSEVFYGKDLARYKLDRAKEEYDTAQLLFDNDKLKASNKRAYYAIYYALTAVLCLEPKVTTGMGAVKRALTKERLINSGFFYELAIAYQSMHVNY